MTTEETSDSAIARQMDELNSLLRQIAETRRQCEVTKSIMRQKLSEMQSFCANARQYLFEQAQSGRPGDRK